MTPKTNTTYLELDLVPMPENIPELGVGAGEPSVIDFVYDDGRGLHVEVSREDGTTMGFVQLEADAERKDARSWRVVAYSRLGAR